MMTHKKTQIVATSLSLSAPLILITLHALYVTCAARDIGESNRLSEEISNDHQTASRSLAGEIQCEVFLEMNENFLTPIDVVARNSESNVACIKARFALSIKVEEVVPSMLIQPGGDVMESAQTNGTDADRAFLGYLPLEQLISVEDSCPDKSGEKANGEGAKGAENQKKDESNTNAALNGRADPDKAKTDEDEQEMIVTFGCGKLAFTFKRDKKHTYVSSIKGVVKLGKGPVREFISNKPVFLTSDLDHHFKYDNKIEITSEAQSKVYILTANFFFTEIEAFRKTTSRDFTLPPDDSSKPYSDGQT